jgi:hypothetical protein
VCEALSRADANLTKIAYVELLLKTWDEHVRLTGG